MLALLICTQRNDTLGVFFIALKLNVSREPLSRLEDGSRIPSLDILYEISRIGRVSLDYLITGEETEYLAGNTLEQGICYVIE